MTETEECTRIPPDLFYVHPKEFKAWLLATFNGFHHTIANAAGVMKTTLAVVPQWHGELDDLPHDQSVPAQVTRAIDACKAVDIRVKNTKKDQYTSYIAMLHNRGQTLQTRAESAVLTRNALVLVKGGHAAHAATRCKIDGHICVTEAYKTIEATAMSEICRQCSMYKINKEFEQERPQYATTSLAWHYCNGIVDDTDMTSMQSLCVKIQNIANDKNPPKLSALPIALFVNIILAAATMQTGFADAGARFRDRTSRQEAARHFAEAIKNACCTAIIFKSRI